MCICVRMYRYACQVGAKDCRFFIDSILKINFIIQRDWKIIFRKKKVSLVKREKYENYIIT